MGIGTAGPLLLMAASPWVDRPELDMIFGRFVMPEGISWLYVLLLGAFATLAQVYMTRAYGATKAGIVGAVSYSNILFSIALGLFVGDPFPDLFTWLGIACIVAAGLAVAQGGRKTG